MKAALLSSLINVDLFGNAIQLNYKGKTSYKTRLGTFITIGMATFILFFGLYSLIEIYEYKNPQITQFAIYEKRYESESFNFGESYGAITFGFQDPSTL